MFVKEANKCSDGGFNEPGCSHKDIIWKGSCMLLSWSYSNILLFDPGLPFEKICNGEPTLKCCKYNPLTELYCHSAFNTERPINCEGNSSAPFAKSYGPCLPPSPGAMGCVCDYLPQCGSPVSPNPEAAPWHGNQLGVMLSSAVEQGGNSLFQQAPDDFVDYVSFVGACAHQQVFLQSAPYAKPDEFPAGYTLSDEYHANDNDPDARYLRGLVTLAVQRVFSGIPNLYGRWNAIASRTWTETEKAAYLANVPDPDATLEACVGEFGVRMLQRADPAHYRLLAAPLEGETQPDCRVGWVGGVAMCSAPSLTATTSVAGATVSLFPGITDPDESHNAAGNYVVQLDWGDGRVEGRLYIVSNPATHAWPHTYEIAGTYTVTARVINTSGLVGETTTQVTVTEGSGVPVARSVDSVRFDLEAAVTAGSTHGRVRVDVSATDVQGKVHSLGYHWVELSGAYGTTATAPLTGWLTNRDLKDIRSLRLKPAHYDGSEVSLRELRLKGVTLQFHASPGMAPETTSYVLTSRDVKVYATGVTVPISPRMEVGSGALKLPLAGAEIAIDLPAPGAPPDPALSYSCRPVYGTDAPLMRSANGGCEDIGSGLVFAVIPSTMNWNDAMWDSALAGSPAPDASDYGRLNDYPGGYPVTEGADSAPAAFCHDLIQGGFSDWRLPAEDELLTVASASKAGAYFPYSTANAWTATSVTSTIAVVCNLQSGACDYASKATGQYLAVCVRSAPPPPEHTCRIPVDGGQTFVSASGGCMDTRPSGLVWSKASVASKSWNAAVWGSELAGNAQPDAADGARLNDYTEGMVPDRPDISTENYCHDLVEGGFSDWRLPTDTELGAVSGSTLATAYFAFKTSESFWSATTGLFWTTDAMGVDLSSGGNLYKAKTAQGRVVCVRAPDTSLAPDLAPTAFSAPTAAVTRQSLSFTWTVTNGGTQPAPATWRDGVYLSQDRYYSHDDKLLFEEPHVTTLAPGASYTTTKSAALPGVPAGDWYLLFRADNTGVMGEKDDANNAWSAVPLTVTNPDLKPTAFTAPTAAGGQSMVPLSWTVTNAGAGSAIPGWYDHVYLSTDATYGSGDKEVTSQGRNSSLAPGASYTATTTARLPGVPAGTYYLLLRSDFYEQLYESDETNNGWTALPITLTTSELVPGGLTAPASARAGTSIPLSWTVTNSSADTGAPESTFDFVYLSTDATCCSGDTLLTAFYRTSSLAPMASYTVSQTVTLPTTLDAGSYNLILSVDQYNGVAETDETNNLVVVPFAVIP
ncbi:CARDB domain-containing protein [Myxococcus eversor]|nr:CARDB domain-containing protein [Myxococcus eversor]